MNIESPKARFIKSSLSKTHREIVTSPAFVAAVDASMLQMADQLGSVEDPNTAAARHYMMSGARYFKNILATIGEEEPKRKPAIGDNLPNPNA